MKDEIKNPIEQALRHLRDAAVNPDDEVTQLEWSVESDEADMHFTKAAILLDGVLKKLGNG